MTAISVDAGRFGVQGFGAMRLREGAGHDAVRVIGTVLDAGVTMIDTADAYGNEELVGRAIKNRVSEVLLASKFGLRSDAARPAGFSVRADPAYVRQACDASLRRLGTETIDLYYLHHRSDDTPIEETVSAMVGLLEQGKIRAIGLSNVTAEDLRRAHAIHPIAALQEKWSLVDRDVETELLPVAAELGVTIVAHSPASHGVLHRSNSVKARTAPPVAIAKRHGATVGQLALAWVHHRNLVHHTHVVPLPGTTRADHALQNIAAAELVLTPAELRSIEAALSGT